MILLELSKSHFLFYHENVLLLCDPYTCIMHIASLPKVSTIAIILLLFLLTSARFPDISSFTKIPTFPNSASFPDHHSLYLCPKVPTKQAPWPFHLTPRMQHTSTLLLLSFSHTSVFLPQRLPTFNVPNLISQHSDLNPEILYTPCSFRSCLGLGAICFFFLIMWICWSKILLQGACPCLPQPQFSDMSGSAKQLSWQPHH